MVIDYLHDQYLQQYLVNLTFINANRMSVDPSDYLFKASFYVVGANGEKYVNVKFYNMLRFWSK